MKKGIICIIILMMIGLNGSMAYGRAEPARVRYQVDSAYPPFTYTSQEYLYGFDPDLTNIIFNLKDYELEYSTDSWNNVYERLLNGEIDLAGIIAVTEERKEEILFTDALFTSYVSVYTTEDFRKVTLDELKNYRIGVGKGYYTESILENTLSIHNYIAYENMLDAVEDLNAGKIDIIFENQQLMDNLLIKKGIKGSIIPQITNLYPREHAYAISKKRPELVEYMNGRIKQLKRNGVFEELYIKYFYSHSDGFTRSRYNTVALFVLLSAILIGAVLILMQGYIRRLKKKLNANFGKLQEANNELSEMNALLEEEIEEHKRSEEELEKARQQAERASAAKTNFLANMSHEIRTPLNGILGMTDMILLTEVDEEQRESLSLVKKAGNSLLRIINDILDYSKMEAEKVIVEKSNFNFREMVREVTALFDIAVRQKRLEMEIRIAEEIPVLVNGDPVRLRQVLSNLVGNAVKFTDAGSIHLSIALLETDGDKLKLLFTIKDTGIGITGEQKALLFERFSQLDSSYKKKYQGTGLGLAISKRLIELMGGEIWLESSYGSGSTFYFTVLAEREVKDPGKPDPLPEAAEKTIKAGEKTIMLVEDDYINRKVVTKFLENHKIRYVVAENGLQAVELFESAPADLILMDVQMPVLDGVEATEKIRSMEQSMGIHTPIIALTAYALKENKKSLLEAGMDDYLGKPLNFEDLVSKLEFWLEKG
jgi:signal transduction histidine kinase/ActR/RegA family two-component response regulator